MPRRSAIVQGDPVRLVVLPRYNEAAVAAWRAFVRSIEEKAEGIAGLDVETTAPPVFEPNRLFGPALARETYVVPSDVPDRYLKMGWKPGETRAVKTRAIQFGTKHEAWVLDADDANWEPHVRALLSDPTKRFVSHNASFDVTRVAHRYSIRLGSRSIDTLVMVGLVWPGRTAPTESRSKGLKEVAEWSLDDRGLLDAENALHARMADIYPRSTGLPKSFVPGTDLCRNCKDEPSLTTSLRGFGRACYDAAVGLTAAVKEWGWSNIALDDPVFTTYAGLDAIYVRRLLDVLNLELRRRGMSAMGRDEQRVKRLMMHGTNKGKRVDLDWTHDVLDEVSGEFDTAHAAVMDATSLKARSPKMRHWLSEHGVPAEQVKSLDKDHLPGLVQRYGDEPVIGPVLHRLETVQTNSNLLTNLTTILRHAEGGDGYCHPQVNTLQAHTLRQSVTAPAMQTFAKKGLKGERLRGCFIARPGHVFVGADWDNQETRIAAALSGDAAYNEIVAQNLNQHDLTARRIWPDQYQGKEASPDLYGYGKTLDFAQQYGAMPRKIAATLGIPVAEAEKMWLGWRETYAGLVAWTDQLGKRTFIRNPFGAVIPADAYGRSYANGNYMIQSTGRGCLGRALCLLADRGWGQYVYLPIHDEIVLEVPVKRGEEAALALGEAMTMHLPQQDWAPILVDVEIPATGEIIGDRWRGL